MFEEILNLSQSSDPLSWQLIIISIVLAFIMSLSVAITYRKTHKGLSYSQSFSFTIVLIGVLITVIMMVIGNSIARAFGAFGAFSLIRFRTAIKDTKDLGFILIAVAIGLATGTGNYLIAIIATVASIIIVYALTKMNFGSIRKYDYILNFSAKTDDFSNDKMREVFGEFLKYDNLLNVSSRENGQILDYSFNIKFVKSSELKEFMQKLDQAGGISDVDIISAKNDIEY